MLKFGEHFVNIVGLQFRYEYNICVPFPCFVSVIFLTDGGYMTILNVEVLTVFLNTLSGQLHSEDNSIHKFEVLQSS